MDRYRRHGSGRTPLRIFRLLLLLPLIAFVAAFSAGAPATLATPKAQPLLLQLAADQPHALIDVIVQRQAAGAGVERRVAALGGELTTRLGMIDGFAARVPGRAVRALAAHKGVRWISYNAPVVSSTCSDCVDTSKLQSAYIPTINADKVWNESPYLHGEGIGVAVIDSGIAQHHDLQDAAGDSRITASVKFVSTSTAPEDDYYGHGTHIAGIIGGNGARSKGSYIGVAPEVNLINVRVADDEGSATTADVINGIQWIYENKDLYNIRVVNISLNSSVAQSYHESPLDAACEILWFNGIVVVVSAGNSGSAGLYPPANDPFVITVGALDDQGTLSKADDTRAGFSAYGVTEDGFNKPDLVAPGVDIISLLSTSDSKLATDHPDHLVSGFPGAKYYFRMSGTSMSAPMTAGAAALLLQDEPDLTPDQVKFRLLEAARPLEDAGVGAGSLDVQASVKAATTDSANTGIEASQLLWSGNDPPNWLSSTWGSVNWGSVNWGSVNWGSVNWGSVNWGSDSWQN